MVVTQESRATRIGVEDLAEGRQRGRRRGRGRLCARGHLSGAPGQYRRRRQSLIHLRRAAKHIAIDYRETLAGRDRARHVPRCRRAKADAKKSREHGLAIGVPGTVAGLALAHRIRLEKIHARAIDRATPAWQRSPAMASPAAAFGAAAASDQVLDWQTDLATSLTTIATRRPGTRSTRKSPLAEQNQPARRARGI